MMDMGWTEYMDSEERANIGKYGDPDAVEPCGECGGEGRLRYRVSREMAIDAGDESWEGSPVDLECLRCEGTGARP